MEDNRKRFLNDVKWVETKYPDLKHSPTNSNFFQLEGDVPIYDSNGYLRDFFSIRIEHTNNYPKGFANLYEIGNEIPKSIDWHKYENSECCVCAMPEVLIQQEKNLTVLFYLEEYSIPFLVNYLHKKQYGFYPNGEYDHGGLGTIQWYQEKFPNCSKGKIIEIIKLVIRKKGIPKHYQMCICGSDKKFKKCHYFVFKELSRVPPQYLLNHLEILRTCN